MKKDAQERKDDRHGKPDHPTHPVKDPNEVNAGQHENHNVNTGNESNKDRMVDIGRGENTAGRQGHD